MVWLAFTFRQSENQLQQTERRRLLELHSLWATAFLKIILTFCSPTGGRKILNYSSPTIFVGKEGNGEKNY